MKILIIIKWICIYIITNIIGIPILLISEEELKQEINILMIILKISTLILCIIGFVINFINYDKK